MLAPAAVIRAHFSPREIRRRDGWRGEIELDHTANLVQPAGDTRRQPEVSDPLTGNPDDLRGASTRRLRAGRIAALGACEAAPEHDQVCPRIGRSGRDRPRLQPVLGGMFRGGNTSAVLTRASFNELAEFCSTPRVVSAAALPDSSPAGGSRRDRDPDAGGRRRHRDRGQPLKRWKTVHVHSLAEGRSPTTTIVGRARHATSWLDATLLEPRGGA